jgi:ADP-ribosylation factor GTPase-activating protein 1
MGNVANQWSRQQFGVDVAASVGGAVGSVRQSLAAPSRDGYTDLAQDHHEETSALYHDDEDFFGEFESGNGSESHQAAQPAGHSAGASGKPIAKGDDGWDDEWKDF